MRAMATCLEASGLRASAAGPAGAPGRLLARSKHVRGLGASLAAGESSRMPPGYAGGGVAPAVGASSPARCLAPKGCHALAQGDCLAPPALLLPAAMAPRLPRRHVLHVAASAAAVPGAGASDGGAAAAAAAAAAVGTGGAPGRRPRRVCIMVEPSPFTYVCGYMNRYRNTIRFLTEAGVQVLVVTPGPGVTVPGAGRAAGWLPAAVGATRRQAAASVCALAAVRVPPSLRLAGSPHQSSLIDLHACRPPAIFRPPPPGVDFSAACEQPAEFEGARVVQAFSFGLPWYLSLPLSFGLSPRIYREIK